MDFEEIWHTLGHLKDNTHVQGCAHIPERQERDHIASLHLTDREAQHNQEVKARVDL